MAKKLLNPSEDPPTDSSSEDDEVENSSEEEEDEPTNVTPTKTLKSTPPAAPETDSDSETEASSNQETGNRKAMAAEKEGSDDSSPAVKSGKKKRSNEGTSKEDMHVKRAKPVSEDDEKKSGKAIAEGSGDSSGKKKRSNEGTSKEDMHVKRAKTVSGKEEKKPYFQRLWSEEDEICVLQGMIDFKAEKGTSPYDDMNGFYDIFKKNISFGVTKTQFSDKIRMLKRKYIGIAKKEKSFQSSHDKKCLRLAKNIWGSDGLALDSAVKSLKQKGEMVDEEDKKVFEKSFLVGSMVSLGVDECSVMEKWSQVPMETKKRIEEKLMLVKAKEFEVLFQKTDILKEVTSVMIPEAI